MIQKDAWLQVRNELDPLKVTLVAVSKTKPVSDIQELYGLGQRDFGENYVQELAEKQLQLPADIRWHFIGHLQGNKVKYIAPFVSLIHTVDSYKLLTEISRQAQKCGLVINVLLQVHIAEEETKFGLDERELNELLAAWQAAREQLAHVRICGLMGMATNTDDEEKIASEFARLHALMEHLSGTIFRGDAAFAICSMGMSSDYRIAIREGSTMVRIGSLLFGSR